VPEAAAASRAERCNESILGTGFWFLGEWIHSPVDIRKDECDRVDNMIDVFSKTFLGLTVELRPLSRSQVRRDQPGRLLRAGRLPAKLVVSADAVRNAEDADVDA
jgi:hypothetical protein